MTEYWFKLNGDWDYGPDTVSSQRANLTSDKQARAYAIRMIKSNEKKIPLRAYVEIRKIPTKSNRIISVGDVTSYKPVGGNRTYRFISYGMLARGIGPRPLNQDGSFKRVTKKKPKTEYGIKGKLKPFGL